MKRKPESSGPPTPEQIIRKRILRLYGNMEIASFFQKLILMGIMLWVLFGKIFGITPMRGNDMSPKLSSGDLLIYYRLENVFRTDDVLVFEKNGKQYVGRVAAQGGDSVEVTDESQLKVNGSTIIESNIFYPTVKYADQVEYPVSLAADEYFILCDYRNGAKDSRYFGPVKRDEIKGKVLTVVRRSDL